MLALTLWSVRHLEAALPTLVAVRPGAVQVHTDPVTLDRQGAAITSRLRAELPQTEIWVGLTGDLWFADTKRLLATRGPGTALDTLHRKRMLGIHAAKALGATRVIWNAEAAWKHGFPGFDANAASSFVVAAKKELGPTPLRVTSFDCPGFHSAFPYKAFDACDGWDPQIYAAPEQGVSRLEAARRRLTMHDQHWHEATKSGVLRSRPVVAYVQAHHVTCEGTAWIADAHDEVCFWAVPDRLDEQGVLAARSLAELERRGFTGIGRIGRFQASVGLKSDGVLGPTTRAALGL